MADPFIAEIRIFFGNFAPRGWSQCEGQLMPISQNTALFSLLGTMYGGDGRSTFALPDLKGRAPLGYGISNGQSFDLGQEGGLGRVGPSSQEFTEAPARGTEESTESVDLNVRATAEMQQVAEKLSASQELTQDLIKSHTSIISNIKNAVSHVRDYRNKSMDGEFEDAGASLKALLKTVDALKEPNVVPELKQAVKTLTESQEKTRQMISILTAIISNIENATSRVREYQSELKNGQWKDAGATLELLIQTIHELEHIWETKSAVPAIDQRDPGESERMTYEQLTQFVAVNFIIATEGIFPARS